MADQPPKSKGDMLKQIVAVPDAAASNADTAPAAASAPGLQGSVFSVATQALNPPNLSVKELTELMHGMTGDGLKLADQLIARAGHLLSTPLAEAVKHEELKDGSETSKVMRLAIRRQARLNDILTHLIMNLEA